MSLITKLAPHEVFIFGTNRNGFHGAGAAGYAMRGTAANTWRTDKVFLNAMRVPVGHPDRVGKWAVYGVAHGLQHGWEGKSYGIVTIERPGALRSVTLDEIKEQFVELFSFAEQHPGWSFLMTEVGAAMAGYTKAEMLETWREAKATYPTPSNVIEQSKLYL